MSKFQDKTSSVCLTLVDDEKLTCADCGESIGEEVGLSLAVIGWTSGISTVEPFCNRCSQKVDQEPYEEDE